MKNLSINTLVIIVAIILGLSFAAGLGLVSLEKKSDYITVGGQTEYTIHPDVAVTYFTITTLEDTAQKAQDSNTKIVDKVRQGLKSAGIEDKNIATSNYNLNKKQDWTADGPVDKGYELIYTLKTTTKLDQVSTIIKTAVDNGANSIDRIEFVVTNDAKNSAVAAAMSQATQAAKTKAQKITSDMGTRLGRVLKIEEGSYWITEATGASSDVSYVPPEYSGNLISPQTMAVQANVNVVFKVN